MRSILATLAASAALISAAAIPAQAKTPCKGSSYACESAKSASKYSNKATKSKSASKSRKANSKSAKVRKAKPSYSASAGYTMTGKASYYWQPQRVASGGWFNPNAMTAAHKTLPFGTKVRVTNKINGKSVVVTINDRGPYIKGRIIDLSKAAAKSISMTGAGVVPVSVAVLGRG
jgi:rare lipoprotein A